MDHARRFARASLLAAAILLVNACAQEEAAVIKAENDLSTGAIADTGELWIFATVDAATVEVEVPDATVLAGVRWKAAGQIPPSTYFDGTTGASVDAGDVAAQKAAGRDIESQPTALKLTLDPGVYKLRVTADGYSPMTRDLFVERHLVSRTTFHLSYASGGLQVETDPAGFSVYLDGKQVGLTPLMLDTAPVGDQLLQIDRAGFQTYSQRVLIQAGDYQIIRRSYSVGRVSLTSEPDGATVVDGAGLILGRTPCVVLLETAPQHLRFEQSGWEADIVPVLAKPEAVGHLAEGTPEWNDVKDPERLLHGVLGQDGLVPLGGIWIGRREVTNREWRAYLEWLGTSSEKADAGYPFVWEGGPDFSWDNPVAGVSWDDANRYCQWLSQQTGQSYRLPSLAEWKQAARPRVGRTYPWGDIFSVHCANAGVNSDNRLAPADSYHMGRSAAGCLNMVGNVAEWTSDKSVAGGSYHSPLNECTVDSVEQVRPESRDYRVGFRVARN